MPRLTLLQKYENAKATYYNNLTEEDPKYLLMTDEEFDKLEEKLKKQGKLNENEPIVGSTPIDSEKVKLPAYMGSLDKAKTDKKIELWKKNNPSQKYIVSEKVDGISIMLQYDDDGKLTNVYRRGDGNYGTDITEATSQLSSIPRIFKSNGLVRGELVFINGKEDVKAPRNFLNGLVSKKNPDPAHVAKVGQFLAFDLITDELASYPSNLNTLAKAGFSIIRHRMYNSDEITVEMLRKQFQEWAENKKYEIDGVVIHIGCGGYPIVKENNPKYALAFKDVSMVEKLQTKIISIEWNETVNYTYIPTIHIETVVLAGANLDKATGKNYKNIIDNKLGKGAVVNIIRSGGVIPEIVETITPSTDYMLPPNSKPDGVNLLIVNPTPEQQDKITCLIWERVAAAIGIKKYFDTKVAHALVKYNINNLKDLYTNDMEILDKITAEKGITKKKTEMIKSHMTELNQSKVLDLILAINILGKGISKKKIELLLTTIPDFYTSPSTPNKQQVLNIKGFSDKTVELLFENRQEVREYYTFLINK